MPFQGSAADLIKLAMVQLHHQIETEHLPCALLLQIHDELLFEIPAAAVSEMLPRIQTAMEGVWPLRVPLTVDIGQGSSWAEAH
jgi:DNA polymerase-1